MRRIWVLLLVGCGLDEDGFRAENERLKCERTAACVPDAEPVDCSTVAVPPASTIIVCTFDGDSAQACLDAIPSATCTETGFESPPVCLTVFVDCENPVAR